MAEQNRVIIEYDDDYVINIQESGSITYIGTARTGTATSAAQWRIRRLDETTGTIVMWADGDKEFDNIFDDRGTLSYS